ncbi:MAG: ABC transporter substrate-binding protein [Clostridiales bacterium]|nr:ABC transporter substrate-binding protein [Clostridiales bacterium]
MKKLKIYWNNICLLRKGEEVFINGYIAKNPDVVFDIEYFGLGMPKKLRAQIDADLAESGDVNADVIVSTELDIFWDKRRLKGGDFFVAAADGFEACDLIKNGNFINPERTLAVAQVLPMLIAVNESRLKDLKPPETLQDLCSPEYKGKIVLGGADTAAGRSVAACVEYLYGAEGQKAFLDNAAFAAIPAMAYSLTVRGAFPVCILPSVLCGRGLKTVCPRDGAPAIPTYVCIHKKADYDAAKGFLDMLFDKPMQEFYAERGFILPSHKAVAPSKVMYGGGVPRLSYPDWGWLNTFGAEAFSDMMDGIRASAR